MKRSSAACLVAVVIGGCAGYDQWAENTNKSMNAGWTEMLNGKQTVEKVGLPKDFNVELSYGKGEGVGIPRYGASRYYDKLTGQVTYARGCARMLSFNVALYNDAGALIRTEPVVLGPYPAGARAQVNKDVMTDPTMSKSSQVTRLVVSNVQCL